MLQTKQGQQLVSIHQDKDYKLTFTLNDQTLKFNLDVQKSPHTLRKYELSINQLCNPQTNPIAKWFETLQDIFDHIQESKFLKIDPVEGKLQIYGNHPSKKNSLIQMGSLIMNFVQQIKNQNINSLEQIMQICQNGQQADNKTLKKILKLLTKQLSQLKLTMQAKQVQPIKSKESMVNAADNNRAVQQQIADLKLMLEQQRANAKKIISTYADQNGQKLQQMKSVISHLKYQLQSKFQQKFLAIQNKISEQDIQANQITLSKSKQAQSENKNEIKDKIIEQDKQIKKMIMEQKLNTIKLCGDLQDKLNDYIQKNDKYLATMNFSIVDVCQKAKSVDQKLTKLGDTATTMKIITSIGQKYRQLASEVNLIQKDVQQLKIQMRQQKNSHKNQLPSLPSISATVVQENLKKVDMKIFQNNREVDEKIRKLEIVINENKSFIFSHINNLVSEDKKLSLMIHNLARKQAQQHKQPPKFDSQYLSSQKITRSISSTTLYKQQQKKEQNKNLGQIQIIDRSFRLGEIQMKAKYSSFFKMNGSDIILAKDSNTYTMLMGTKDLRKNNTFSVKLKKIKEWIYIGMVDANLKGLQWCSVNDNAIVYSNNQKLLDGKQWGEKVGAKFYEGETVRLRVDFDSLVVQWQVGNQVRCKWICSSKLKFKQIEWVPMVEMGYKGDTIQWVE